MATDPSIAGVAPTDRHQVGSFELRRLADSPLVLGTTLLSNTAGSVCQRERRARKGELDSFTNELTVVHPPSADTSSIASCLATPALDGRPSTPTPGVSLLTMLPV